MTDQTLVLRLQAFTAIVSLVGTIFNGLLVCMLVAMNKQRMDESALTAIKVQQVKETLEVSNEMLAKEETLQALKNKR